MRVRYVYEMLYMKAKIQGIAFQETGAIMRFTQVQICNMIKIYMFKM